jgi:hypothetical protein
LAQLSTIYSQYRFTKLKLDLVPNAPTIAAGQLAVAIDSNVEGEFDSNTAVRYVMGCSPSQTGSVWQNYNLEANCSLNLSRQRYYQCDLVGDLSENTQFRLLVVALSPLAIYGTASGTPPAISITVRMTYTCEFTRPIAPGTSMNRPSVIRIPAGTSVKVSTGGVITWAEITPAITTVPDQLWVYALNPCITEGLASFMQPVSAVYVRSTNGSDTARRLYCWSSVVGAANSGGTGDTNIFGTGEAVVLSSDVYLIPVQRIYGSYYTETDPPAAAPAANVSLEKVVAQLKPTNTATQASVLQDFVSALNRLGIEDTNSVLGNFSGGKLSLQMPPNFM